MVHHQLERMDNVSYTILRFTSELSNRFHGMGHCRTKESHSRRGLHIQVIWKEMVRLLVEAPIHIVEKRVN